MIAALAAGSLTIPSAAVAAPSTDDQPSSPAPDVLTKAPTTDNLRVPVGSMPSKFEDGRYIVRLADAPVATYQGELPKFKRTAPGEDGKLDPASQVAKLYSKHLVDTQEQVASKYGGKIENKLSYTLNAFVATLTADQARALSKDPAVAGIEADQVTELTPNAVPSVDFLGLTGEGGVWDKIGGEADAGKGIVVGVLDSGIAPENAMLAGEPLGTTPGDEPYLDGNEVVFDKADGTQFRAERVTADEWSNDAYSTKLIGAQYFNEADRLDPIEVKSPRDRNGHGTHTASTAAGLANVPASIDGHDLGKASGVAPAAKIASYKVCWAFKQTAGCAGSDVIAGIEAAVKNNVDVINMSLGGQFAILGDSEDMALYNAAAAGIFIAASAGNSGPAANTLAHLAPWYATVGATTIPGYEATLKLPDGQLVAGASTTVTNELTGRIVYAGDIPAAGKKAEDAALCQPGTLDAAKAKSLIVLCDRGVNPRTEKSQVVKDAGGTAMVLVNVESSSLDSDLHAVPTIHVQNTVRDQLIADARAGKSVTLIPNNITGVETPTPQLAGFSSLGPNGGYALKPDIAAPGVGILAGGANAAGESPTFAMMSGTSMAAPHIAGLAALYLSERPNATTSEIKSAMMTTAGNTVNPDGTEYTDPLGQGAGQVQPKRMLDAHLLYLNGPDDWTQFLNAAQGRPSVFKSASDLNDPSISIPMLGTSTVTVPRTVTATKGGTYEAAVTGLPGFTGSVEPSSVTLAAGESATVQVTLKRTGDVGTAWNSGFLTWTGEGTTERAPISVHAVPGTADPSVTGRGTSGTATASLTWATDTTVPLSADGLYEAVTVPSIGNQVPGHTGNEKVGTPESFVATRYVVEQAATKLSFATVSSDPRALTGIAGALIWIPGQLTPRFELGDLGSMTITDVPAGSVVEAYAGRKNDFTEPFTWDLVVADLSDAAADGTLTVDPQAVPVQADVPASYQVSWSGLEEQRSYIGSVHYGDTGIQTVVAIATSDRDAEAYVSTAPAQVYVDTDLAVNVGRFPADVDVALSLSDGKTDTALGTLHTDAEGNASGTVRIPADLPAGRYTLTASAGDVQAHAGLEVLKENPFTLATGTAYTRCQAGQVLLGTTAIGLETGENGVEVTISTPWGSKTVSVQQLQFASAMFMTKQKSVEAGELTMTYKGLDRDGKPVTQTEKFPFPALSCG